MVLKCGELVDIYHRLAGWEAGWLCDSGYHLPRETGGIWNGFCRELEGAWPWSQKHGLSPLYEPGQLSFLPISPCFVPSLGSGRMGRWTCETKVE